MALVLATTETISSGGFLYNKGYIYRINAIAALGGILFGFDTAIISGTIHFFSQHFQLDDLQTGWAVGCISIGAAIGALGSGRLSDLIGRKKMLLISAFLFAITGVGTGWAATFPLFVAFRILSGMAIGCAALVCPIYIAEMAPAYLRGRLVSFYQLAVTVGVLLAYLSNYLLLYTGDNNWRWMFSSQSAPALLFFLGLFFVSESPRWLISKKQETEGRKVLDKIGGLAYAEAESAAIRASFSEIRKENFSEVFRKDIFHIVLIGMVIAFASQLGGPLVAYAPEIFKQVGIAEDSAFLQSVILGVILCVFTFVAIATIDKAGRKKLLLFGSALLSADILALSLAFYFQLSGYLALLFILVFIAGYAATIGPVTWVILSEIFPNRIRGSAMSLATLSLWLANFLVIGSFPVMKSTFGMPVTFGIYAVLLLGYFVFILTTVPETKGKSLEEIEQLLTRKAG
ncbi:sugar porter family MFS transporter [Larkinella terrae]|uniref:Sugar porter family MFS transporter n=1 Tax=Larkinella terrae TaxID=2025311 RepID=A0A7K0EN48_9BACT|nr:sugar porter family MFS transporter [Larkinella terrae]MRS63225.1 sugar porter family MFS transporter [Larkinella terrae]